MPEFFIHGPLLDEGLLAIITGEPVARMPPSELSGYRLVTRDRAGFPALAPDPRGTISGAILSLDGDAVDRMRYFASATGLASGPVGPGERWEALRLAGGDAWTGPRWPNWHSMWCEAAREIMSYRPERSAPWVFDRLHQVLARASSRADGLASGRQSWTDFGADDIKIHSFSRPYSNFFTVEEYRLSHRRFDGGMSAPVERAVFVVADAVTVLPYDPIRDSVLLVEQFRVSALSRGEPPWLLEPIAGRIDPGDTPEDAARREAMEEAGLMLGELLPISSYYPSTGCFSEYVHSFLGIADLPDSAASIGGLAHEGEDIRAHIMSRAELMRLIASGRTPDAPLIISAFWLETNYARLKSVG